MTRIVIIGDASSPNVQSFADGLEASGAEAHLLSLSSAPRQNVIRLPGNWLPAGLGYFAAVPWARRAVRRLRPCVVVGYFATGYGTTARLASNGRYAIVVAGSDVLVTKRRSFAWRAARKNLRDASLVVCWSDHLAGAAEAIVGAPLANVLAKPRGIVLERFRFSEPTRTGEAKIIVTRSLQAKYHHDVLVRAVAERTDGTLLTVVGDGPARRGLERLTQDLGVTSRVVFTGAVSNDRLGSLLAQSDVYVSLSPTDGVSASLLEAIAVGLAPVVVDNPANRSWVGRDHIGMVSSIDPASVNAAIDRVLTDPHRRERRWRLRCAVEERGDRDQNMRSVLAALGRVGSS